MSWPDDYDAETVAMSGGTGLPAMEWAARQGDGTTADPLPPPPTRDGDKVGPLSEGEVEVIRDRHPVLKVDGNTTLLELQMWLDQWAVERVRLLAAVDAWKARAQAAEKVVADIASRSPGKGYRDVECSECWTLIEMAGDAVKSAAKEGRVQP